MARPIDADAIVFDYSGLAHIGPYDYEDIAKYFADQIARQPTLTPPNEWVSVEDAVPDPGERVLATDGIFVGEAYRTSADSWHRHTGFPWRDGVTGRTVKYWMLLPTPPAKEDQK